MPAAKHIRLKSCQRWWDNLTPPDDEGYDAEQDALRDERAIQRERHRKGMRDEYDGND